MRLYHFDSITSTTFSIIRQFRPLSVIVSPRTTLTMLVMYSPRSKILRCDVMTVVLVINTHELFIIRNNCAMSDRYTFYHTFAFGILRADGFRQMVHKQMVPGQMFHGPIVQGEIVQGQIVHRQNGSRTNSSLPNSSRTNGSRTINGSQTNGSRTKYTVVNGHGSNPSINCKMNMTKPYGCYL